MRCAAAAARKGDERLIAATTFCAHCRGRSAARRRGGSLRRRSPAKPLSACRKRAAVAIRRRRRWPWRGAGLADSGSRPGSAALHGVAGVSFAGSSAAAIPVSRRCSKRLAISHDRRGDRGDGDGGTGSAPRSAKASTDQQEQQRQQQQRARPTSSRMPLRGRRSPLRPPARSVGPATGGAADRPRACRR